MAKGEVQCKVTLTPTRQQRPQLSGFLFSMMVTITIDCKDPVHLMLCMSGARQRISQEIKKQKGKVAKKKSFESHTSHGDYYLTIDPKD